MSDAKRAIEEWNDTVQVGQRVQFGDFTLCTAGKAFLSDDKAVVEVDVFGVVRLSACKPKGKKPKRKPKPRVWKPEDETPGGSPINW